MHVSILRHAVLLSALFAASLIASAPAAAQDAPPATRPATTAPAAPGFLGVKLSPVDDEAAANAGLDDTSGALVAGFAPQSPAEKAGVKEGDVITKVEGKKLEEIPDLVGILRQTKAGQTLKLTVRREKKDQEISVTLTERPANFPPPATRP
jgi:serine protease DegQ